MKCPRLSRRRASGFKSSAAGNLEKIVVTQPKAEANEQSKKTIKEALTEGRLKKCRVVWFHVDCL
jgi:hypothetical protein